MNNEDRNSSERFDRALDRAENLREENLERITSMTTKIDAAAVLREPFFTYMAAPTVRNHEALIDAIGTFLDKDTDHVADGREDRVRMSELVQQGIVKQTGHKAERAAIQPDLHVCVEYDADGPRVVVHDGERKIYDEVYRIAAIQPAGVVATVIKKGADRQWMSEALGSLPDGMYSLYLAAPISEATAPQPDENAYNEAANLAKGIYSQHYRDGAEQWRVLPDIRGVISQISNMVAGMTRTAPAAPSGSIGDLPVDTVEGDPDLDRIIDKMLRASGSEYGDGEVRNGYEELCQFIDGRAARTPAIAGSIANDAEFCRHAENWASQSRFVYAPEAWARMCARIDTIIQGASNGEPTPDDLGPLFRFYNAKSLVELARMQDQHIAKLQAKLPKLVDEFPRTPREG